MTLGRNRTLRHKGFLAAYPVWLTGAGSSAPLPRYRSPYIQAEPPGFCHVDRGYGVAMVLPRPTGTRGSPPPCGNSATGLARSSLFGAAPLLQSLLQFSQSGIDVLQVDGVVG
jgi:hypothetical protein